MTVWTERPQQSEAWTTKVEQPARTFSPLAFSRRPVFDTGPSAGIWDARVNQAEVWTVEP